MRAILTYHSLDATGSPISVHPAAFAGHVAWLASGRVRVTSIPELLEMSDEEDAVALTFDDGFENFATVAAPLLRRRNLSATVFVVPAYVGASNRWPHLRSAAMPRVRLMDWPTLRRVAAAGFTVAAHTMSHADLATLPPDGVAREISESVATIERELAVRPRLFAYPYGIVTPVAASLVASSFDAACTTELRCLAAGDRAALLPRIDMYYFQRPDSLHTWGTSRFAWYLRARAQARRVRARLARTA